MLKFYPLNTEAYQEIGTLAQMNPPLRSRWDNETLAGRCYSVILPKHEKRSLGRKPLLHREAQLEVGSSLDLNTYSPVQREDILSKCGWSPFEGWNLIGWAQRTIVGGQIVYHQRKVNSEVHGKALQFNAD